VKTLHQKEEQAKIGIRNVREEMKKQITDDEKAKTISEDERTRELEKMEKAVSEWNAQIQKITEEKETEIMTI
jgi:ribosome recycling factor